ncbi:hypothetical protein V1478_004274 [Vespula squamosa]|uniref:Secreted protein n=1 Tax=Vespula squamosa TaxID=30214 RepID=A0ABD2BHG8_VESSQ
MTIIALLVANCSCSFLFLIFCFSFFVSLLSPAELVMRQNTPLSIFLLNHLDTLGPILVLKIQTLGIDSLANRMLFLQRYTLGSEFCELRSLLSPRFYTTLLNRKIVILYCLFQGYQHPENDSVERTAARLFWILAIGSSRLYFRISRFNGFDR